MTDEAEALPVRVDYFHRACKTWNKLPKAAAEMHAREPGFFGLFNCSECRKAFPLDEFVWRDGSGVGS